MKLLKLGQSNLYVSRFMLGTANIARKSSERSIVKFLLGAHELGITHLDTSPLYGFGLAEKIIGKVARQMPGTTLTTKVGLYPPHIRYLNLTNVKSRKVLGRVFKDLTKVQVEASLQIAKESLTNSLKRLNRDRVEVLLLHNLTSDLICKEEWTLWMEHCKNTGIVGEFGISAEPEQIETFLGSEDFRKVFTKVVQSRFKETHLTDISSKTWRPHVFFGAISGRSAMSEDLRPKEVLKAISNVYPDAHIILGTKNLRHLKELIEVG